MKFVVGYLLVAFGLYVSVVNILIAITNAKTKAINEKGYFPSRVTLFDFLPIAIGIPFITNFSFSMNTYFFLPLPLALGLLILEELAYRLTFRLVKQKNNSRVQ